MTMTYPADIQEDWQVSVARDYAQLSADDRARLRWLALWDSCHMPSDLPPTECERSLLRILRLAELVEPAP